MPKAKSLSDLDNLISFDYDEREFRRGDIFLIDLDDIGYSSRYIAMKSRPGLIIQNDRGNMYSQTLIVALITSQYKKDYPFQYRFDLNNRKSIIMFEQIMTIDKFRVKDKLGELTTLQLREAEKALMNSLGLDRLSLENIQDFDVISVSTKRTKTGTTTYFEFQFRFGGNLETIELQLSKLQEFDPKIGADMDFEDVKKIFDNCNGLHWLAANANL